MNVCRYCGKKCKKLYARNTCGTCNDKIYILPKFAKARDDLRQQLGLKRLTKGSECVDD